MVVKILIEPATPVRNTYHKGICRQHVLCVPGDQADPTYYASRNMCPLLVQHGTRDNMVPYEQSESFVRQLEKKGLALFVTFLTIPGAEHEDRAFFSETNMTLVRNYLLKHI